MSHNNIGAAPTILKVADLALILHKEKNTKLHLKLPLAQVAAKIDLPKGCTLVDGTIEFESLEVRNTIVATAAYSDLTSSSPVDPDSLFKCAYELWRHEIGHDDQASGRLLALASESIDILAVGAQRIRSGSDVFNILHLIEAALPYLSSLDTTSIIELITAKYEPTRNDMMSGRINGQLEKWLEKNPKVALELHTKALANLSEETSSLLGNAIIALSKSDYVTAVELTKADAHSNILLQAKIGTWTLGRLLLDDHAPQEAINSVIETLINLIRNGQHEIRSQAISAAANAMHKLAAFDELLQELAENGDQDVLCSVATTLYYNHKKFCERGITQRWFQLLTALKPEHKNAIQGLDYAMSKLLSNPEYTMIVTSTLSQWIANHGRKVAIERNVAELFDNTILELFSMEDEWSLLATHWLLSDQQEHAAALAGILTQFSHHKVIDLKLNKNRLDGLSPAELLFLARRMLGYVYDRAQVTSLALSMLQSSDAEKRIYPLLSSLLVKEIGYDYPGSTAEALHKAAEDMALKGHQNFLREIVNTINQAVEAQNALPIINELKPPASLSRLFSKARAKQMDKSHEEASKKSIIRQIATHIPVKAGSGMFNYRDSHYGQSTKFSTISHSIELPRREVFDPIGNSIRHFGFRVAHKDES